MRAQPVRLRRYLCALAASVAAIILAGCDLAERERIDLGDRVDDTELCAMAPKRDPNILWFGFDLRASPKEDARQYVPFLKYLERSTGIRIEVRFTARDSNIVDDLGSGVVQFAAIGAGSYVKARKIYGVIPLAQGLNAEGRAQYRSVIVTAVDSPIKDIEDLRGRTFAFGSVSSTQGHIIPRIVLAEHGLSLDDLAGYEYTGSHKNCATAVAAGHCHAGGMQDTMGRKMAEDGLIRIIHTSRFYPSSLIAANKNVPPDVVAKVKQALLDFQPKGRDAAGLYHWDRTEMPNGFVEAHDEAYAELRKWCRKFGMLSEQQEEAQP